MNLDGQKELLDRVGELLEKELGSRGITTNAVNLLFLAATLNGYSPPSPAGEITVTGAQGRK